MLGVEPADHSADHMFVVLEFVRLGLTFDKSTLECGFEDWRMVACELLVHAEFRLLASIVGDDRDQLSWVSENDMLG